MMNRKKKLQLFNRILSGRPAVLGFASCRETNPAPEYGMPYCTSLKKKP